MMLSWSVAWPKYTLYSGQNLESKARKDRNRCPLGGSSHNNRARSAASEGRDDLEPGLHVFDLCSSDVYSGNSGAKLIAEPDSIKHAGALTIRYSSNDARADSATLPTIPPQLPLAPVGAYGRCRMDPSYALIGSLRSPVVQIASFQRGLSLPAAARCSKWTWQSSGHRPAWSLIRRVRHHHPQILRQPHQQ